MPNRLIIVESPSKARTLARFLGRGYTVLASMGHVRDLPKSKIGVDVDNGFTPQYEVIKGKEKPIKELKAAARKAEATLLAADPDREGEAIAWHVATALDLRDPDRVVFHEITKGAVEEALAAPRKIDRSLVEAQEARRVIDRLVGYRISPLLWRKVKTGLSAGRVQSVAVRLVVDREREIDAFVSTESWTIDAILAKAGSAPFQARLLGRRGEPAAGGQADKSGEADKLELPGREQATEVAAALGFDPDGNPLTPAGFRVASVDTSRTSRSAPLPYTTSTLQQDASTRLRFSPRRTMALAQQLYEGLDLGSSGPAGLITYMRTDSTRISETARADAARHITSEHGAQYLRSGPVKAKARENVQDAHEAVRPTDVDRTPESIAAHLEPAQLRLYDLIWRRFVASQMAPARFLNTRASIEAGDYVFRATGSVLTFDGFQKVWKRDEEKERDREKEATLPALDAGDHLGCERLLLEQHFTQPPPRFTEASLIKELEERGIGRPSTYAPTIEVIEERGYVRQEERRLHPTALGTTVDGVLREHFPTIVDIDFTADLEKRLDGIEDGSRAYEATVREWYGPFDESVARADTTMQRVKIPARETGETCPECEVGQLVIRDGRYGEFTGCSRYPECTYIKREEGSRPEPTGAMCPQCGKPLVTRMGRRGPFVGCSAYPECRHIEAAPRGDGAASPRPAAEPTGETCPDCGKPLVKRRGRFGPFVSCSGYPGCRYRPPRLQKEAS